jgi:Hydrazine synthase alpha subunit middle domain/WD40-like Beta Propeller Repeat
MIEFNGGAKLPVPGYLRRGATALRGALAALAGAALLAGCSGGGNIDIGSGQSAAPGQVDFPIAYVKRSIPDPAQDDARDLRTFFVDADVFVKDRADASVAERNVTERITRSDMWDVRDLDVSADGRKLLFSMRGPMIPNGDEEDQPTWNVWEYTFATDALRRVITSDIIAEEGHDVAPHYLPDGRIVFTSTRQRAAKAVLLDEGKPQFDAQTENRQEPSFVLHVMNADGTGLKQVSFGQSHDMDPTVLMNGRVLWSRWDTAPGRSAIHLYTANPDGTDVQLHYGALSHLTGTNNGEIHFFKPREMPDGRILSLIRPLTDAEHGGDLVMIDARNFVENTQPVLASAGLAGPAQSAATGNDVRTVPGVSPGGRFSAAYPLWDGSGRIAVSWTPCRALLGGQVRACTDEVLRDPAVTSAPPLYSIWMYDTARRAFLPLTPPEADKMITDIVVAQPRSAPVVILDRTPGVDVSADLVTEGVGVLDIKSVYDFDGVDTAAPNIATVANPGQRAPSQRLARFLRLEKAVSLPDRDTLDIDGSAFGASNFMREILGYAMVEPDGSVRMKVPANVAFQISVLDGEGKRYTPVHRNWLQVRPGEVLACNGCHTRSAQNPRAHGRAGLFAAVYGGATGGSFPGADPTLAPQGGETMAQTRARLSCQLSGPDKCSSIQPSVDVLFEDIWTTPAASAGRAKEASFAWKYADLTTPSPTTPDCGLRWSPLCRITINYARHIHPLWSAPRTATVAGVPATNVACTACHSPVDAANAVRVPAGQLDLSDGASDDDAQQLKAYRELLFTDNAQEVNMGALRDILVTTGVDPVTGLPQQQTVPVAPSAAAGNARGSTRFFARFGAGGTHTGYLSPAELRLLAEWLDIGAQYFNNPFDPAVPLN